MPTVLWVCIIFVWPGMPNMGWLELIGTLYVSILHRLLFILSILHRPLCYGYVRLRIPPLIFSLSLSNLTQNQNIEIIQLQFFDAFTALQFELDFCLIFDDENGKQNWPKPWRHYKGSIISESLLKKCAKKSLSWTFSLEFEKLRFFTWRLAQYISGLFWPTVIWCLL